MSKKLRHFIFYFLTIFIVIASINNGIAQNRYWVNGTGNWNDTNHWAESSGGKSGASVPQKENHVIFDDNSFTAINQSVLINSSIDCKNFNWDVNKYTPIFKSKYFLFKSFTKASLNIYGSLIINQNIKNEFFGDIALKASDKREINTNSELNSDLIINTRNGEYILIKDFATQGDIILKSGTFNTNNRNVSVNEFIGSGSEKRIFNIGNSTISVNKWDFSETTNLDFLSNKSVIEFKNQIKPKNAKLGNLDYYKIKSTPIKITGSKGGAIPVIQRPIPTDSVTCNGGVDGKIYIYLTGATDDPVTYKLYKNDLGSVPTTVVTSNDTVIFSGLSASKYYIWVFDSDMDDDISPVTVYQPKVLNVDSIGINAGLTCSYGSDAELEAYASGGNEPYSYQWIRYNTGTGLWDVLTTDDPANKIYTGASQGWYKVLVTGALGCDGVKESELYFLEGFGYDSYIPSSINITGVTSTSTCSGFSTGSITVSAIGGTPSLKYAIVRASDSDSTLSATGVFNGLQADTYKVYAIDGNDCFKRDADVSIASLANPIASILPPDRPANACPGIPIELDGNPTHGDGTAFVSHVWTGTDADSLDNKTIQKPKFTSVVAGSYDVIYTVTDNNGCIGSDNLTIVVGDAIAPTAVCQNINVQLDATGNVSISGSQLDGGSSDNCTAPGDLVFSAAPNSFDCTDIGVNPVVLTVTDELGNFSTCIASVTVVDNISPTAVCKDITVQLDATGNVSITPADVDNGSTDNCSDYTLSLDITDFTCADIGPNTVNLTIDDQHGQTANCTATVTVEDNIAPTVACKDITVQLDATGNVSITPADVDNGSGDNCSDYVLSLDKTAFTCADIGANVVTLTIDDQHGQTDNCVATVTVEDNLPPTAVCKDITVYLDATGNVSITPADVDNGSTDNCSAFTLSLDITDFSCADIGANAVTLTIDDQHGQTDNCNATVTVVDNIAPTAVCKDITVQLDATGNVSISGSDINNGSSDNCTLPGSLALSAVPNTFDCTDIGANVVTLTVTDAEGNSSNCNATVTVEDNISPTAICKDITVQLDATGNVTITPADVDNGSGDNCADYILSLDKTAFTCADLGANAVTLTIDDQHGQTDNCVATVTVEDNLPPTAICKDITVYLDATGNVSITPADVDNGSTDNCSDYTLSLDITDFTCADIGANAVTLTIDDQHGQTDNCIATVTVMELEDPIAVCKDITVQLDATGNVSITPADVDNGSSDNCTAPGDLIFSVVPNSFNCANIGANLVTLTVTDEAGNSANCTATVTVEDNIAPTVSCKDITVQLDATGNVTITPADVDNGSGDNCADYILSLDKTAFTCADLGANAVTLTIDDQHGQTDNCVATVTVEDNLPPTAICKDITVYLDATGNVSITPADVDNGSTDNCSDYTLSLDITDFTCADIGANAVTLTIDDQHGQTDNCIATVTVVDNIAPTAVCKDITVQLDATGNVSITPADVDNGSTDNCSDYTLSLDITDFTCADIGPNTVTLTIDDQHGQTANCTAIVTVDDNIAPTVACKDITVQLDATGNVTITPADVDNGSGDNCADYILSLDKTAFTCADIGANVVTLTIDDQHGQTDNCVATVTVEDNLPPTAICKNITVYLDATGNVSITPADVDNGSTDNCSDYTLSLDITDFSCADIGANAVTLTIDDQHGQTDNCIATVTVVDNIAPTAVCKDITVQLDATGNVSITPADVDNGSTDNCLDYTLSLDITDFTCADIGPNTVTLTINDQHGQIANCTATVTVEDNIAPTVACKDITVQLDATGNVTITPADVDNGSGDNCADYILSLDKIAFTCADIGANVVTLTIDDQHGQTDNCVATVTVEDNLPPTAICKNITVYLDATGNVSITPADVDNGSTDNCSDYTLSLDITDFSCADIGANAVTLTIDDQHGQTDNCIATVTVVDNIAPTAVCKDITVQLDATGNVSISGSDINNGSSDNCTLPGSLTLSAVPNTFDCTDVGANVVTLTVTDAEGNSSNCNATVTVEDNISPAAICKDITVQLDATGNVSITPSDVDNGSGDNCTDYILSLDKTAFTCADLGANAVTLTIDDQHGQTDNCVATVTVEDNIFPTISCPANVLVLEDGSCSAVVNGIAPTTDDNCGITIQTWTMTGATINAGVGDVSGETFNIGITTVTYHIEDAAGNFIECSFDVEVYDVISGGLIDADQTVCYNSSPNPFTDETPATVCGGRSYQWQMKSGTGPWGDILGAIDSVYTELNPLTEITYYNRKAISDLGFGTAYSDTITITIQPGPFAFAGKDTTICYGTPYQILDADTTNSDAVSWEILSGNGTISIPDKTKIDPVYVPAVSDGGTIVELVLHASGKATCGEATDTIRITYPTELLVSIGKPTPFFIDSSSTHINVYFKIESHKFIFDLGLYLISPLDSVVELKTYCIGSPPLPPPAPSQNIIAKFYNDPFDTSAVYATTLSACSPVSGNYKFLGDWKKKLHGQDPANGAWRVRIGDDRNISGSDGFLREAVVSFSDTNMVGVFETILLADSSINLPIKESPGSGVIVYTDRVLPIIGLTTTCFNTCDAAAVSTASGGIGSYSYAWNTSLNFTTPLFVDDTVYLCPGKYYVQATDSLGCTAIDSVTVGSPPEIIITNRTFVHNTCNGDSIGEVTLEFAGGSGGLTYTHDKNTGPAKLSGETFDVLKADKYIFTISDGYCSIDTTIFITEPTAMTITVDTTNISCYGVPNGIIDITVSGGTSLPFYEFSIDSALSWHANPFINLDQDTFYVAVRDGAGCIQFADTIEMLYPDTISIDSIKVVPTTCSGGGVDGQIIIYASGGASGLQYSLDGTNFQLSNTFTGLSICDTTVFVKDKCGTKALDTLVSVIGPKPPVINSIIVTDVNCFGDNTGQLTVNVSGGTGILNYYINGIVNSPPEDNIFKDLTAGSYTISVIDGGGCSSADSIRVIKEPSALIINGVTVTHVSACNTSANEGQIIIDATGGTLDYEYAITGYALQSSNTFSNLVVGDYTVTVRDFKACEETLDTSIVLLPAMSISLNKTDISCYGGTNGSITVNISNGKPDYSYSWSNGEITSSISNLSADIYTVTVTDGNTCEDIASIEIIQPQDITIDVDLRNKRCINSSSRNLTNSLGRIIVDPDGGTPGFTYNWTGPSGFTDDNDTIINLQSGLYNVTVTDFNFCTRSFSATIVEDNSFDILSFDVQMDDNSVCWNDSVRFTSTFVGNVDSIFMQVMDLETNIATNWVYEVLDKTPFRGRYKIEGDSDFERIRATNQFCKEDTTHILIDYFHDFELDIVDDFDGNALDDTIYLKGANSGNLAAIVLPIADISFAWTPIETLSSPNEQATVVTPSESGWYRVIATSTDECVDSSSIYLEFIPAITPNDGFSPNDDGINDYWTIKYIDKFQNNIVTVYNRWGVKVYEQKGYRNDDQTKSWNGKAKNGKDLPSGTYYYVIILNEAGFQPITGPITIIR